MQHSSVEKKVAELKRHIKLCSLTESISMMIYDSGVAMGGYCITKSAMFSDRFNGIAKQLPESLEELKHFLADNPAEDRLVDELRKIATATIESHRQTKKLIDDPKIDVARFKQRHVYKTVRAEADGLREAVQSLRAKDLALIESNATEEEIPSGVTPNSSVPETHTEHLVIFLLAIINAISGTVIMWLFAGRRETSG